MPEKSVVPRKTFGSIRLTIVFINFFALTLVFFHDIVDCHERKKVFFATIHIHSGVRDAAAWQI